MRGRVGRSIHARADIRICISTHIIILSRLCLNASEGVDGEARAAGGGASCMSRGAGPAVEGPAVEVALSITSESAGTDTTPRVLLILLPAPALLPAV